jgi:flagellar basal-body rod protein FlgB
MPVSDLPLFSMLKTRMRWLDVHRKVLAENVANANTPQYRVRDPKQLDFKAELDATTAQSPVRLAVTQPRHITGGSIGKTSVQQMLRGGFETKPNGNAVVLEEEMMRVGQTKMDHQITTSLYARGIGMIKTALGKR